MVKLQSRNKTLLFGQAKQHRKFIIGLLILFALGYAITGQLALDDFSWSQIANQPLLILLAIGCLLVSYGAASGIYCLLTIRMLKYDATYLVQVAASFASRIVPAGLGSVGVNYLYLRRHGAGRAQAGTVVAVNNLLGMFGNVLLLIIVLLLVPLGSGLLRLPGWSQTFTWLAIAIGGALILAIGLRRQAVLRALRQIGMQLSSYRKAPWRVLAALALSVLLTMCYVAILWLSAQAVGASISAPVALLAMTVGAAAISVTPTPGGLGGVEAGIVAVLTISGLAASTALGVALLFRVITFWLPLVLGGIALLAVLRLKLL